MKLIKTKLIAAVALAAISFAALSFTTTPVAAHETVSTVKYTPLFFQDLPAAALAEANELRAAQLAAAAVAAARRLAEAVAAGVVSNLLFRALFGYELPLEELPMNALD